MRVREASIVCFVSTEFEYTEFFFQEFHKALRVVLLKTFDLNNNEL